MAGTPTAHLARSHDLAKQGVAGLRGAPKFAQERLTARVMVKLRSLGPENRVVFQ